MRTQMTSRLARSTIDTYNGAWQRQRITAADILRRLEHQEGVILADQVGMGKTYVALAVAVSQILSTEERTQVVVLAPSAVAQKWVDEWNDFTSNLLPTGLDLRSAGPLRSAEEFFAALDDPPEKRSHLVVVTHRALTSTLKDTFIQLALLRAATQGRPGAGNMRAIIAKWSLGRKGLVPDPRFTPARVAALLDTPPVNWRSRWTSLTGDEVVDDLIPAAIVDVMSRLDLAKLRDVIATLPRNRSASLEARLRNARVQLKAVTQDLWSSALAATDLHLPLLIVDEAHRLKNGGTQISRLFAERSPEHTSGALADVFDRMLLLTATPFELGHQELINVLSRLGAVRDRPDGAHDPLDVRLERLRDVLKEAQATALSLDQAWGKLRGCDQHWFAAWRQDAPIPGGAPARVATAWRAAAFAVGSRKRMHSALQPWVIRHERERRRRYLPGASIRLSTSPDDHEGLAVDDDVALPFLLAARAQTVASDASHAGGRPLFAYGIASSFEAYRRLGAGHDDRDSDLDTSEDEPLSSSAPVRASDHGHPGPADWYRQEIDEILVRGGMDRSRHPKVAATVERAADLWVQGDKCLVFCWYIATGKAMEQALSARVAALVEERARTALEMPESASSREVYAELSRTSERLLRSDSGSYKDIHTRLVTFFSDNVSAPAQDKAALVGRLVEVAIRHLRTPEYLVRYTSLGRAMTHDDLWAGLEGANPTGGRLLERWSRFAMRMSDSGVDERERVLTALLGDRSTSEPARSHAGASLDSVRRAHGGTHREVRERLTTLFNTPFAPDLLVASSVMGEGIDLHLECRHVIHHDLDWNPSTLEQRTGRLDRIGALTEHVGQNIDVYEPYLAGTHDEKMYRVVKDRAGWFDIVMGRPVGGDEHSTDHEELRSPLARPIADALTMNLASPTRARS